MTDYQERLFELLSEVDDICSKNDIKYFLSSDTALAAYKYGEFTSDCYHVNVAMTPENVQKFMKAAKKAHRSDRTIDSMRTNRHYPDFTVRYGDRNTAVLDVPYVQKSYIPNIAVTIDILRYKPSRFTWLYEIINKYWKATNRPIRSVDGFCKRAVLVFCRIAKLFISGRCLFNARCRKYSKNTKAAKLALGDNSYKYASKLISSSSVAMFENREFPTFSDPDAYLRKAYGVSASEAVPKKNKLSSAVYISTTVPYDKYTKLILKEQDTVAVYLDKKNNDRLQKKVTAYNKKVSKYYNIVDRTETRFALYEQYMPIKDELISLYKEQRYEELNDLLMPYRSALWKFYKKGLGLCFDKDIFEITTNLLLMEDQDVYVNKLRKMIPEAHLLPITLMDYKRNVIKGDGNDA